MVMAGPGQATFGQDLGLVGLVQRTTERSERGDQLTERRRAAEHGRWAVAPLRRIWLLARIQLIRPR